LEDLADAIATIRGVHRERQNNGRDKARAGRHKKRYGQPFVEPAALPMLLAFLNGVLPQGILVPIIA
jgi:hypothetical protein